MSDWIFDVRLDPSFIWLSLLRLHWTCVGSYLLLQGQQTWLVLDCCLLLVAKYHCGVLAQHRVLVHISNVIALEAPLRVLKSTAAETSDPKLAVDPSTWLCQIVLALEIVKQLACRASYLLIPANSASSYTWDGSVMWPVLVSRAAAGYRETRHGPSHCLDMSLRAVRVLPYVIIEISRQEDLVAVSALDPHRCVNHILTILHQL